VGLEKFAGTAMKNTEVFLVKGVDLANNRPSKFFDSLI